MDYDTVVGVLRYVAETLEEHFKKLEGGSDPCPKKKETTSEKPKKTKKAN